MDSGNTSRETSVAALAVVVASVLIVSTVAAGAGPLAAIGLQEDGDEEFPPDSDEYDDPLVEYETVDLQVTLASANESDVDYEILAIGAVEPANETAEDTVSCEEQYCVIEGTVGADDRPAYNLSGVVVEVRPDDGLEAHVNGTLEGDALIGLGWGAAEGVDPLSNDTAEAVDENVSETESESADTDEGDESATELSTSDGESTDSDDGSDDAVDDSADSDDEESEDSNDEESEESDDSVASTSGDLDCSDFDTRDEAQDVYEEEPGVHDLDRDDDDVACESLP